MSVLLIVCLLIYPANSGALVGITGSGNFSFPPLRLATSGHSVVALKRTHNDTYTPTSWKAIAIKRKPRVVAGSLAAQWGALSWDLQKMSESRWTALYDVLALPRKLKTKVCDQASEPSFEGSIFYVHNSMGESEAIRPSASGSSAQEPQIVREMSLRAFLASAAVAADSNAGLAHQKITKKDKQYSYLFSTEYTVLEDELQLHADTSWRDLRILDVDCQVGEGGDCLADETAGDEGPAPQLTLMHPGSALQARLTEFHTVRAHLQGEATYHLLPPHASVQPLHIYPSIHRCANQAQINVYEEGGASSEDCSGPFTAGPAKFPSAALFAQQVRPPGSKNPVEVQTVRLRPGEVLYVPPYWTVHTEAHSLCVILDVLSVSLEQRLLLPAWYSELPFQKSALQTTEERVVSAQVFLVHLLSRVHGISSVLKFATALYRSRFAALYPEDGLFMQRSRFQCLRDQPGVYDSIVRKLDPRKIEASATFIANQLNSPLFHYNISTSTNTSARNAGTSSSSSISTSPTTRSVVNPQKGVKWAWLSNYIENMARWAMGDADQAVLFIRECLYMDTVIEIMEEVKGPGTVRMEPQEEL